ncbi:hypothetical protein ELE36_04180 [Pseudolysobacter antarcticus]|uniref:Uncharacterized protein n=1 Tax=Pseudolysobacter antarcticus TaxID=2511995 RepID=A0A411HGM2_9GAMM|nr:hypothetical protein [Pseudolysobacter antarcticus]QBB69639.1 hypothetical protein ELE36_04180 [Pseudolysobacter antarcticus]
MSETDSTGRMPTKIISAMPHTIANELAKCIRLMRVTIHATTNAAAASLLDSDSRPKGTCSHMLFITKPMASVATPAHSSKERIVCRDIFERIDILLFYLITIGGSRLARR